MRNFSVWSQSRLETLVFGLETLFLAWSRSQPQFGRSRSRLRDLGLPELEPPKKVAAPQHCIYRYLNIFLNFFELIRVGTGTFPWILNYL